MPVIPEETETPDILQKRFEKLGFFARTWRHPPVFTVEEGRDFKDLIPGGHTKNLFLKDKKGSLLLVTALWDTQIDLKSLPEKVDIGRVSFGSAALLQEVLDVLPGSVTPLALLNDTRRRVRPVLDARLMDKAVINCHPLRNDMTTGLAPQALVAFLEDLGYDPLIVDFNAR